MTIKPIDFHLIARRRPNKTLETGVPSGVSTSVAEKQAKSTILAEKSNGNNIQLVPFTVLFGGNSGTCEGFAQDLETKALDHGLQATVRTLDSATENLPTDQPVVIITSSYEGQPPDNAKKFVTWLKQVDKSRSLKDVNYTVFGVGNSDWANTFHRVPKFVNEAMAAHGANCFLEPGSTDVKTDLVGPWEDWIDNLWEALSTICGTPRGAGSNAPSVSVQSNPMTKILGTEEMSMGTVVSNKEIAGTEVGLAKKHMVVKIPEGEEYTAGDYLVVLPRNPESTVKRVLKHFELADTDFMTISGSKKKFLLNSSMPVGDFLSTVVELSTPITKRQVETLTTYATNTTQSSISKLKNDDIYQTHLKKRYSILDILEEYSIKPPFAIYISMLQPLTPRQYSISSSPLHPSNRSSSSDRAELATITYDVVSAPAWSRHGLYHGVSSTFLASRQPGDRISCFIRKTKTAFRLPANDSTPVIMIAAGTGIAPMRAFIQERAAILDAGVRKLGPAVLFFGCRNKDADDLYKEELGEWEAKGVVQVKPAFSRDAVEPKHVQNVIWENRDLLGELFRAGGKILLCGSAARLGKSAAEVCKKIYRERTGCGEQEADEWLERQKEDRYVSDLFD